MKRPEYVAAAVTALKNSLVGGVFKREFRRSLLPVFTFRIYKGILRKCSGQKYVRFPRKGKCKPLLLPRFSKKYERIYEKERAVYKVHFVSL